MSFASDLQGVETAQVLDDVAEFVSRFIAMPSESHVCAVALWTLHTHAIDAAEVTPYLNITSAEKRSGKTRLLEVVASLVRNGVHVANISEAALFRMLDATPTLLIDEVDALFASNGERTEALRGIVNAGNRRGAVVYRCVGAAHDARPFGVFGAKVLGGIDSGKLPDTIRDRSITLRMKRKVAGEQVERLLWHKVRPHAEALRNRIADWGAKHADDLRFREPTLPRELDDRAAEAWWALLAIADLAGGDWPQRARTAAIALHADGAGEDESRGVRLLSDLRSVYGKRLAVFTADVLTKLNALEESPWGAWHEGEGLRSRDLARLLRPFGVRSKKVKVDGESLQGYHRDDLEDAWARYLPDAGNPDAEGPDPGEPAEPPEPSRVHAGFQVPFPDEVPEPALETEPHTPLHQAEVPQVPEVPLPLGSSGYDPDAELERLQTKFPDLWGGVA
jgi:hypothetical protein